MTEHPSSAEDRSLAELFKPRLPELLVLLRERADWSQSDLADKIGVTQSFVSRIETGGVRRPQRRTLMKIARAFQDAGIAVELEQLEQAADAAVPPDSLDLDERLLRIHDQVSTFAPATQDAFYDALYASFRLLLAAYQEGREEEAAS